MLYPRADVYRNLNRKCVSIRICGRVVSRAICVIVTDVEFRVQSGVLASVRRAGVRSVCAYARGDARIVDRIDSITGDPRAQRVHFNPFTSDTFTLDNATPVYRAGLMAMESPYGAWVIDPVTEKE
jgi:hypothetical protein